MRSTAYIDRGADDAGLPAGDYGFTVVAVDAEGNRGSSAQQSTTVEGLVPGSFPFRPTGFSARLDDAGLGVLTQNVKLSWNANSDGPMGYWVYRSDVGPRSPIAIVDTVEGLLNYSSIDPQVGWGRTVTYGVTAVDDSLNESLPATASTSTPSAPLAQGFSLTIKVTGRDAFVTVASLADGDVFDVNGERIVPASTFNAIFVASNQKQGVTFRNLPYSTYHLIVTAVDSKRVPLSPRLSKEFDVELVRNETVTITF
jgi:fibronectin type 3 domain-containing protein